MRAIVQREYGGPGTWELAEVPVPAPGSGEVLVRVAAAGLDAGTWHLMTGEPRIARLGIGLRRPRWATPGRDVAGVVEAVGPGVIRYRPGDRVFGTANGSFAEYAVVPVRRLAWSPAGASDIEVAAVPVSGITALNAVRSARVTAGQRVLVIGASGGVGTYAVQLATAYGAEVTAVCSGAKADLVRSLGATRVIDYAVEEIDAAGGAYDAVLDIAGDRPLRLLRSVLAPRGTLVLVGSEGVGFLGGLERTLFALMLSPFTRQRLTGLVASEKAEHLETLAGHLERGEVRPVVDSTYPLEEAPAAMEAFLSRKVAGKVVVTVGG